MTDPTVLPVLLAGGAGTRLWPESRRTRPKQFIALRDDRTLFQETCERVTGRGFRPPLILASAEHRFLVAEQAAALSLAGTRIVLEPSGRDTAPAACTAALLATEIGSDALVLLTPCDHVVPDADRFRSTVLSGAPAAMDGAVVVFGVRPTQPHTGYGYIEIGANLAAPPYPVARFVEKPDRATATAYLASGRHFWNAGIFLFRADRMLEAFRKLEPKILESCKAAIAGAQTDPDFIRLAPESYAEARKISLDYAIMEKTAPIACVPLDTLWSDCGSWASVREIALLDRDGNATRGDVIAIDATESVLRSEGRLLVVCGLDRVVAVATPDAVLLAALDRSEDVKRIVRMLEDAHRAET